MIGTKESRELNRQRVRDANYERAEKYAAETESIRQNAWTAFLEKHAGFKAVQSKSVFFDCAANRNLLEEFIKSTLDRMVDLTSLETAFKACRDRLAAFPNQEYTRRAKAENGPFMAQQKSFAPPSVIPPFTKQEIQSFGPTQLRAAIKKYGAQALNKILQQN